MKTLPKLLAGALLSVSLLGCGSDLGTAQAWKPGNMKFTTGLSAPQPIPRTTPRTP